MSEGEFPISPNRTLGRRCRFGAKLRPKLLLLTLLVGGLSDGGGGGAIDVVLEVMVVAVAEGMAAAVMGASGCCSSAMETKWKVKRSVREREIRQVKRQESGGLQRSFDTSRDRLKWQAGPRVGHEPTSLGFTLIHLDLAQPRFCYFDPIGFSSGLILLLLNTVKHELRAHFSSLYEKIKQATIYNCH